MRRSRAGRGIYDLRFDECGEGCVNGGRDWSMTQRRRLDKRSMHRRHSLAAILVMMA
jgi:hypothetical protein